MLYLRLFDDKWGSPSGTSGKEPAGVAGDSGDLGLIPALRGSPGGVHGNPLQYSYLENPMDRELQSIGLQRVGHD